MIENQISESEKLKRARRVALTLATAMILCVLFFIYSYIQKSEADRQKEIAEENFRKAQTLETELRKQNEASTVLLQDALQQLEECKNNK